MGIPSVKIVISCHKEIPYPKSDVFIPVQVGAANAKTLLLGTQPDNEGENISSRNSSFCELTAQYWAWKNLDADYIGQCHYRRFFCLDDKEYEANDHGQIEETSISPVAFSEYRLDDAYFIKNKVSAYDMVVPVTWNVRRVITPSGVCPSIKEHMISYGLVSEESFSTLETLVRSLHPEYSEVLRKYLEGDTYIGYNCFIMRKDLFNELCSFEFDILLAFDELFDYDMVGLTANGGRICGYLAEVLFSCFVMKMEHRHDLRIHHYPLVFFKETEPLTSLDDRVKETGGIPFVWRVNNLSPAAFTATLQSLLSNLNQELLYEIFCLVDDKQYIDEVNRCRLALPSNAHVTYIIWPSISFEGIDGAGVGLVSAGLEECLPAILSWLIKSAPRILWACGPLAFSRGFASYAPSHSEKHVSSAYDVLLDMGYNHPGPSAEIKEVASAFDLPRERCFDCSFMDINAEKIRQDFDSNFILDNCKKVAGIDDVLRSSVDCEDEYPSIVGNAAMRYFDFEIMPFMVVSPSLETLEVSNWASVDLAARWKKSSAAIPSVVLYKDRLLPQFFPDGTFSSVFWCYARQIFSYEQILAELSMYVGTEEKKSLLFLAGEKVLPVGSRRRQAVKDAYLALRESFAGNRH